MKNTGEGASFSRSLAVNWSRIKFIRYDWRKTERIQRYYFACIIGFNKIILSPIREIRSNTFVLVKSIKLTEKRFVAFMMPVVQVTFLHYAFSHACFFGWPYKRSSVHVHLIDSYTCEHAWLLPDRCSATICNISKHFYLIWVQQNKPSMK